MATGQPPDGLGVFVEITRPVIPAARTGQRLPRYRLIELYGVRVLITRRFTYDVLSTAIIENAGNPGFSTHPLSRWSMESMGFYEWNFYEDVFRAPSLYIR